MNYWCSCLLSTIFQLYWGGGSTGETHYHATSHWQILSNYVVSNRPHHWRKSTLNFGGERHWLIALLNVNITTMRSRPDGVLCRLDWVWYNYKAELLRLIQKCCSFTIICVQVWNWILSHVHLYPYSFFLFFYQKIQKCTKNSKQLVQVLYTMYDESVILVETFFCLYSFKPQKES
jgi:hypothetical protein